MIFSRPLGRYQLLKIDRADFTGWQELPPGYAFLGVEELDRDAERALLELEFPHWEIPFHRKMLGSRPEWVVCVGHEGKPVALAYVCDRNASGLEGYGEVHYAVVHPDHRGRGLFRAMVTRMFEDPTWQHLRGGVFYSDREGHRALYERWGGAFLAEKVKHGHGHSRTARARVARRLARVLGRYSARR